MKAPVDKYFATIFLGAAELIGALTCVLLVHVTGKRPLVFTSLIGCGLCFCGAATYANYLNLVPGAAVNNVVANVSSLDKSMFIDERNLTDASIVYSNDHATNSYASADELIHSTFATTDDFTGTTTDAYDSTYYYDDVNDTLSDQFDEFGDNRSTDAYHTTDEVPHASRAHGPKADGNILPLSENPYHWMPLTLLIGGAYFAHIGIRLIPWMLIGEVFPVSVRSGASGISSGIGYIFGFLSNKLFLGMVANLTLPGTFWFYSAIALIGCITLYFVLPETEGKTLLEIEKYFVSQSPDTKENGDTNRTANGFDQVTALPPSYPLTSGSSQQTLRIGADNESLNGKGDDRRSSIALDAISAVPEIIVSTPRAGSKRFMKTTDEVRRMSGVNLGDDSTDL